MNRFSPIAPIAVCSENVIALLRNISFRAAICTGHHYLQWKR